MSFKEMFSGWFGVWAVFCLVIGLGFMGVVIWAIITVVNKI